MILDDFTLIRFLGGGTSGTVHLVREKSTGLLFALKSMPKFDERNVHRVFGERDALLLFQGEDRVMQFYASFHDSENFYIVTVSWFVFSSYFGFSLVGVGVSPCGRSVQPNPQAQQFLPRRCQAICRGACTSLGTSIINMCL